LFDNLLLSYTPFISLISTINAFIIIIGKLLYRISIVESTYIPGLHITGSTLVVSEHSPKEQLQFYQLKWKWTKRVGYFKRVSNSCAAMFSILCICSMTLHMVLYWITPYCYIVCYIVFYFIVLCFISYLYCIIVLYCNLYSILLIGM